MTATVVLILALVYGISHREKALWITAVVLLVVFWGWFFISAFGTGEGTTIDLNGVEFQQ